jgi:hypothetical protein
MNLHGIVSGAVGIVNQFITATLKQNTGYITGTDGSRTATFSTTTASIQVQPVPSDMLSFLDNQGIQGVLRSVYLEGDWQGIIKADQTGGDILTFQGHDWMVVQNSEAWPDWSKVIVSQQV